MSDKVKSEANTWGLNLPAEDIPEEWEDDERMGFMFSTFKDRSMNPISWDAKMKFWKINVQKYCVINELIHIDESTLKKAFERKGKFPACLLKVMEALKK